MILVLTGATATGKSKIAISLAKRLGGAVVNADAFQVYRDLHIATAMPSEEERLSVPHFLFDFVPLDSSYSAFEYQGDLRSVIAELSSRDVPIIIAGGTGLYIRAGLYDYEFPPEKEVDLSAYEKMNDETLYRALLAMDEASAKATHPHNRVRVMRAIKVFLSTGQRKSDLVASQEHKPLYDVRFFGLQADREPLYERVNARVDAMFEAGLVEENKRLVDRFGRSCAAFRAIGVKELFPYFDGIKTLEECKEDIKKNTRHYVKRQETFFRNQFDIEWVRGEEEILRALYKNE